MLRQAIEMIEVNAQLELDVSMPWAKWIDFRILQRNSILQNQTVETTGFGRLHCNCAPFCSHDMCSEH
jgi:hypothetical protein